MRKRPTRHRLKLREEKRWKFFFCIFIIGYKVYIEYNIVLQNSNYGRYLYMGGTVNMEDIYIYMGGTVNMGGIYIWEEL